MHQPLVARANLDRLQPAGTIDRRAKHKIPINVAAACRQRVRLRRLHDQIRLAELPAFHKLWRGRQIRRISFRRTALGPIAQPRDVGIRKPQIICKFWIVRRRQPRRHQAPLRHFFDQSRVRFRISVRQQREWRCFSRPVAWGARPKKNRRDIACIGRSNYSRRVRSIRARVVCRLRNTNHCQQRDANRSALRPPFHFKSEM